MRPSIPAFVALVLSGVLLFAVPYACAADSDNLLTGYSLTSWTDGDGVPLGTVYAIAQDRDGYLWIATDAGLMRFDGSRFTPWASIGDVALPASPASALWVAADGCVWVGLSGNGARRICNDHIRSGDQPRGPLGSVTDLVQDHLGAVWAISDGALNRVRNGRWERVPVSWNGREVAMLHLFIGRTGHLWLGTIQGGTFIHHEEDDSFEHLASGFTWGVGEDAHGAIWTTDIVAGFRRLGDTHSPRHPFEGSGYRLMHDRHDNLWVATLGDGLWRVRNAGADAPVIERTALRTGLSSDSVQSLLEDREGNIWVGTTGGLHRLTERKLTPIEDVGFVVDVVGGNHGSALAGTTNGLVVLSGTPGHWERARDASGGPDVRTLYRDASDAVWIGTNDGVRRFAAETFSRVPLTRRPTTATTTITAAPGGVWLGFENSLFRWDGRDLAPIAVTGASLGRITLSYTDSTGRLWLAFDTGRIAAVGTDHVLEDIGPAAGLPTATHTAVYTFFEDHDHTMWIGGTGGVSRVVNGHAATITRDNGLPGSRVWSIVDDDQGCLWLSIDRGLLRVARDELVAAASDRTHRLQYRLYDTSDGLAGAPLGNIRSARGSDGRLWFVRGGGLTQVDPRHLDDTSSPSNAPVRIEAAVANEERLTPDPMTTLPAGTRRLQISYTAVALTASNKLRFRYRLDGFDTDWVEAGARRQAFYTNLSPRRYRFRVEADSEDGAWKAAGAAWDFAIQPAFYQTSAFFAASFAVVALVVTAVWRTRLRRVHREFSLVLAERARLSREIHDTLLQSLVGVALQFDAIGDTLDRSSSAARDQLVRIRRQVEAYIREARQSIWDLRSPVLETHDLAAALRAFGKRAATGTSVRFAVTVNGTPRRCPPKVENQMLRIGQEAITNAMRHARAARITVDLRFDEHSVTLRVADDGQGFEPAPRPPEDQHYGLTTMRERAEELRGRFTVDTNPGRGTTIEAVVPISATA